MAGDSGGVTGVNMAEGEGGAWTLDRNRARRSATNNVALY